MVSETGADGRQRALSERVSSELEGGGFPIKRVVGEKAQLIEAGASPATGTDAARLKDRAQQRCGDGSGALEKCSRLARRCATRCEGPLRVVVDFEHSL